MDIRNATIGMSKISMVAGLANSVSHLTRFKILSLKKLILYDLTTVI